MCIFTNAQDIPLYKRNAIAFNLTRSLTNELNFTIEHFFSERRSVEINVGLVYVNNGVESLADDWTNSHYFSEHGFSARMYYKIFKRKDDDDSKWRDYVSPGISFRYLYFNKQWFKNDVTTTKTERIYQSRFRDKVTLEILWGKVYEMNSTFAFEIYYGAGLSGTVVHRTDILKQPDIKSETVIPLNFVDDKFYLRPALSAGVKFRIAF